MRICSAALAGVAATLFTAAASGTPPAGATYAPSRAHAATTIPPHAQPGQIAPPCATVAEKDAHPDVVRIGGVVSVTLHLAATCGAVPLPVDIVLLLDRSTSMYGPPIAAVRAAARAFVQQVDLDRHRVGVVSFADLPRVDAQLARRQAYLLGAIDSLQAKGGTDIAAGIREAARMLANASSASSPVIVLLTDGFDKNGDRAVRQAAAFARAVGVTIVTIAVEYGAAVALMREIASSPDFAYVAPTTQEIAAIYDRIAAQLHSLEARNVSISDWLPSDMAFVSGSDVPTARVSTGHLSWEIPVLPAGGITLTYRVRPSQLGLRPTNASAHANLRVSDGRDVNVAFPVPFVEVVTELPSPTPSPTGTSGPDPGTPDAPTATAPAPDPTASPGSAVVRRYLPSVMQRACPLTGWPADVTLVMDASTTMLDPTSGGRSKIVAAREGALTLARALVGRGKRLGIVSFHHEAYELAPLTDDPTRLQSGLDALEIAGGSRIDLGLEQAAMTLAAGAATRPDSGRRLVVLATDGRPAGVERGQVIAAARSVREAGIYIHVVAIGVDADSELLAELAEGGALWNGGDGEGFTAAASEILAQLDCN